MRIEDQYKILEFKDFGDERGNLVVVEGNADIPFDLKRVFYIYGSDPDVVRGMHANRKTEFVLINVGGTSKVKVDNGFETVVVELNRPPNGNLPAHHGMERDVRLLRGFYSAGTGQRTL